jgi:predicted permease
MIKTFTGGDPVQVIFKQLSILYIFLLVGWLLGKIKKDKAPHSDIISVLLVNVFLPCKVFNTFANNVTVSYLKDHSILLLSSVIVLVILVVIAHFVSKLLTKHAYERKIYAYSIAIANYAYLGYALIESVFGESVLAQFMLFAIPFIFYTYTIGYAMLTGGKAPIKRLLNPITVAIVIGLVFGLAGWKLPDMLTTVVSSASACVGPLSMLLTGITLSTFAFRDLLSNKTAYLFSALRLVVIPAVAYFICRGARLDWLAPMVLIITCMPCGLNTIVFPKLMGEDCKPGARLALITHVFSLITLPCWLSLLQ